VRSRRPAGSLPLPIQQRGKKRCSRNTVRRAELADDGTSLSKALRLAAERGEIEAVRPLPDGP
jgi:hypothetical protein